MNRQQQKLTEYEFLDYVEQCLEKHVFGNFPLDWDEDFITRNLLKALRNLGHTFSLNTVSFPSLTGFRSSQSCKIQVEWDLYKLTGKMEKHFGDIAIYVISAFPNKIRLGGVAFAEAKKIHPETQVYEQINQRQLKRIIQHAPKSYLLLYDWSIIPVADSGYFCSCIMQNSLTAAACVSIDLVLQLKRNDRNLYIWARSFPLQLMRHIKGFDLHYEKKCLDIVKAQNDKYGLPKHVLLIRVGVDTQPPDTGTVEINRGVFEQVRENEELQ